jgi:hypothetical protein
MNYAATNARGAKYTVSNARGAKYTAYKIQDTYEKH